MAVVASMLLCGLLFASHSRRKELPDPHGPRALYRSTDRPAHARRLGRADHPHGRPARGARSLRPDLWLGVFTAEPSVLEAGATYLHVVGPAYLLTGLGLALYSALQGAGRPLWPLATAGLRLAVAAGGGWPSTRSPAA